MTAEEEGEHNWVSASNPEGLLGMLEGRASDRKRRLFLCAACRDLWPLLPDHPDLHEALVFAERWADAPGEPDSLARTYSSIRTQVMDAGRQWHGTARPSWGALHALSLTCHPSAADGTEWLMLGGAAGLGAKCVELLRDVFANPFRETSLSVEVLAWQGGTLRQLAQGAYDERQLPAGALDPAAIAVLADALEDAGCADESVTTHLREPRPHVRGCWVVDLILGKA
jgi:hypothetical protein